VTPTAGSDPDQLRDVRALARFELFLFSAVATVLIVRAVLAVSGYPQVGGAGLHVAHVLWGGLLMGIAIIAVEIMPGTRVRLRAALVGGIGFGLFIDEIGKFLTKDVDYFFRPAIAIMYAVFVLLYLGVRAVRQRRKLTDRRRLALASQALADLALGQLDLPTRNYALSLLRGVDETSGLAEAADSVQRGLLAESPEPHSLESWLSHRREAFFDRATRVLSSPVAQRLIIWMFVLVAADIALSFVLAVIHPGNAGLRRTLLDTGLPSAVSGVLVVVGVIALVTGDRRRGLQLLQTSVLIALLFTQVVVFSRQQWLGLIGFGVDLLVLWALRLALIADGERSGR
jgi:hypothetical protein